jgi:hypothetical protein
MHWALRFGASLVLALTSLSADAVPSFARQTGLDCSSCHLSWLELTSTGRQFKLSGYTWGERQTLPIAGMLQLSRASTRRADAAQPDDFPKDRSVVLQQASVFLAGKITDHVGAFAQWSYDGVAHRGAIDNVDIRYANTIGEGRQGAVYGVSLNNNPTVQDIYNTGGAWGFPFASPDVAVKPNASSAIDGLGQQVAGLGAYALWRNMLYGELTAYQTAERTFSLLRAGTERSSAAALKGLNPYWRLALQQEWSGTHSAMVGAYGMTVDRYPVNTDPTGPTDRFRDLGLDAQYQYLGLTDEHRMSAQINHLRERQSWNASAQGNASDKLSVLKAKLTYYYQTKYGVNLGYFALRGDADSVLYNTGNPVTGSSSGSPNSRGYVLEFNYLPQRDVRLVLQYTGYAKFNGARVNYDGFGRDAKDNNTLYLLGWFMF